MPEKGGAWRDMPSDQVTPVNAGLNPRENAATSIVVEVFPLDHRIVQVVHRRDPPRRGAPFARSAATGWEVPVGPT